MLTQEITYFDYNGEPNTEKFYFHLSVSELTELQLSVEGGYDQYLLAAIQNGDTKTVFEEIKNLVFRSYGERDESGKKFVKSNELSTEFIQSPAFDALLVKMMSDADYTANFVNGIVPPIEQMFPDLSEESRNEMLKQMEEQKQKALESSVSN